MTAKSNDQSIAVYAAKLHKLLRHLVYSCDLHRP